MDKIIGRKNEIVLLNDYMNSGEAEFVVVYGRRRVGKTFLVRSVLQKYFTFYVTGLSPAEEKPTSELQAQLQNFSAALRQYGGEATTIPTSWAEAFAQLRELLESKPEEERQVVFIDEMPWMDSARSGFQAAFEAFWNGWGSGRNNLMLVVCGSATSWIINNLVNNHGGLYNRITHQIALKPFNLYECEKYAESRGLKMSRYDILSAYMILGGIPYYWRQMQPKFSLAQNIDALFFASKYAPMKTEYKLLFSSLFKKPKPYQEVISALNKKGGGMTREELAKALGMGSGGALTEILTDLVLSDFITDYRPIKNNGATVYKLSDLFCLFYLRFVADDKNNDTAYWSHIQNTPKHNSWCGLSFERVCQTHIEQIKRALQIGGVLCNHHTLKTDDAQIDLLLERGDHVTNLCEIKFSQLPYVIDKEYERKLGEKLMAVRGCMPKRNAVHLTMITTYGVKQNQHSGIVQSEVRMDDLFEG